MFLLHTLLCFQLRKKLNLLVKHWEIASAKGVAPTPAIYSYSPGTNYASWVKAHGCALQKSFAPYEWLDSFKKLDYPGLPPYECWTSTLTGKHLLSEEEYGECVRTFKQRGMQTYRDWNRYYNNLDVVPFVHALNSMRSFYADKGIDILKDAVSLPGVSRNYLLRGTGERGDINLFAPRRESKPLKH